MLPNLDHLTGDKYVINPDDLRDWSEDMDETICAICGLSSECECFEHPAHDCDDAECQCGPDCICCVFGDCSCGVR